MKVKMRITVFVLLFALLITSCKSGAKPQAEDSFVPETARAADGAEQQTAETDVPLPQAIVSEPEPPPEEDVPAEAEEPAEPQVDLAETDLEEPPPAEAPVSAAIPEPESVIAEPESALADQPSVVEPPPAVRTEGPPESVTPPPPARLETPPPLVRPSARPEPPRPPEYLAPAEEERPPAVVREPVPLPQPPASISPEPAVVPIPPRKEEAIVFSRVVRATVGQLVEVPFRGSGWVYLGETGSHRGIVYNSRRLDPEGQSFIFRIEAAGTYALKFYKQDFIRDFILNDYVQVLAGDIPETVGSGWFNAPVDRGRVAAEPRWPSSLEEAERRGSAQSAANAPVQQQGGVSVAGIPPSAGDANASQTAEGPQPSGRAMTAAELAAAGQSVNNAGNASAGNAPVIAGQPSNNAANAPAVSGQPSGNAAVSATQTTLQPEAYLQKAKEEFDAGKAASAIALLDQFSEQYPLGSDEAYWLYGQFYEANSPSRDILTALDYYRRLVREYPQSTRYNDAYRRIAYLERYYINIQ